MQSKIMSVLGIVPTCDIARKQESRIRELFTRRRVEGPSPLSPEGLKAALTHLDYLNLPKGRTDQWNTTTVLGAVAVKTYFEDFNLNLMIANIYSDRAIVELSRCLAW